MEVVVMVVLAESVLLFEYGCLALVSHGGRRAVICDGWIGGC